MWENIDDDLVYHSPLPGPATFNETLPVRAMNFENQLLAWWRVVADTSDYSIAYCATPAPTAWLTVEEPSLTQNHPVSRPGKAEGVYFFVCF